MNPNDDDGPTEELQQKYSEREVQTVNENIFLTHQREQIRLASPAKSIKSFRNKSMNRTNSLSTPPRANVDTLSNLYEERRIRRSIALAASILGSLNEKENIEDSSPVFDTIHPSITSMNMLKNSADLDPKSSVSLLSINAQTETNGPASEDAEAVNIGNTEAGQKYQNLEESSKINNNKLRDQFYSFFQPSDNKLAMKLFGNKKAVDREKRRQIEQGKWIIHPCSTFRFYWNLIMLVLLILNLVTLPVAITFFSDNFNVYWMTFNIISDTIFLLDILVNFRTGVIKNNYADEIVLNPKEITKNYLRTWFILDLISSLPIDYVYKAFEQDDSAVITSRALKIFRLAKLLSLLRLLRLSRLVRYVNQWEEFLAVANKFLGIFNMVLLMLLLGHWNACLQFLIPFLQEFPRESWVAKCKLEKAYWFDQYTWALFKALSHMLSIGYGRFPPVSIGEAWITIVSMMTGATCYALFVGHAAAVIQSFDTSKRNYRDKLKQVEEYMAYRKIPRALRQRITNYYEHKYQGKMFNERDILEELSECLREQIVNYNCRALVAAVPFFTHADQNFVSEVVIKLKHEVFQPGDIIIREGTLGKKMYFIQEGIVDIIMQDGSVATSLSDGSYFGEICLLTNARRSASVRAETYCYLYSLDQESFLEVLENYPLMRRTMESVAAERLNKIGKNHSLIHDHNMTDEHMVVKEIVAQGQSSSDEDSDSNNSNNSPREPLDLDEELKGTEKKSLGTKFGRQIISRISQRSKKNTESSTIKEEVDESTDPSNSENKDSVIRL